MVEYYSQYKQDIILNEAIFRNMRDGVFCEVGAYDGIKGSNTLFFEKYLNWEGICIEPMPIFYKRLCKNRNCITLHCCAYDKDIYKEFTAITGKGEMLSGLTDCYNNYHMNRVIKETIYSEKKTIQIRCIPLKRIFEEFDIKVIDYLSIDTEGSELNVIKGIDFENVHINVISIEDNYPWVNEASQINDILIGNNFYLYKKITSDKIYVNKDLKLSKV